MSNTLPNLTDLSPDFQVLFAAQAAELIELKPDVLGQNLTHVATRKCLKSKVETTQAALIEERAAHSLVIKSRDMIISDLRLQLDGHKKHRTFWTNWSKQMT